MEITFREAGPDDLPAVGAAVALYRSFGFGDAAPYVYNPVPGAMFMEKGLSEGRPQGGLG